MTQVNQSETRNSDNHFIRKVMKKPLLEREYELELATRWRDHDDHRAMHELVLAYGRLVVSAASKYRHYGLSLGDLIQEGNIGLMQAARRFEPERGFSLFNLCCVVDTRIHSGSYFAELVDCAYRYYRLTQGIIFPPEAAARAHWRGRWRSIIC